MSEPVVVMDRIVLQRCLLCFSYVYIEDMNGTNKPNVFDFLSNTQQH